MKILIQIFTVIMTIACYEALSQIKIDGRVTEFGTNRPLSKVIITVKSTGSKYQTNRNGFYALQVGNVADSLIFSKKNYSTVSKWIGNRRRIDLSLQPMNIDIELDVEVSEETAIEEIIFEEVADSETIINQGYRMTNPPHTTPRKRHLPALSYEQPKESYKGLPENKFTDPLQTALSTFSIDVDAASYSNIRRFINYGTIPPKDAVRIEEMINYFSYDYPQPKGSDPFSINTEIATAPWNENHLIVQIGLQGRDIATKDLPNSNLVFLLDVSGSMSGQNKLPLLKSSLRMLVSKLRKRDRVSIVVYAGAAGTVLEPTTGNDKQKILEAIENLKAGGSTAGGAGIQLAYKLASENFIKNGNNRIILASDGDFNVGLSSNKELEELIKEKRGKGIFLSVLGFGMGNYKDDKMEILADKGNGNYAYIDNIKEARKVLVSEFGGTLFTIAKDVKIQVEFNPAKVLAYRLIGYENRMLEAEDFNNDKKDAGELGSGHRVTALYEIIPVGSNSNVWPIVDPLKYQKTPKRPSTVKNEEWLTVKFRYKQPEENNSKLIVRSLKTIPAQNRSDNLGWAGAVAGAGMLLRKSEYAGDLTFSKVIQEAGKYLGDDSFGHRREFIELMKSAELLIPVPEEMADNLRHNKEN